MLNFLVIVVIIAVAAWLSNALIALDRGLSAARGRVRASNDTVARLEEALQRVRHDTDKVSNELAEMDKEESVARTKLTEAQKRLQDVQTRVRQKLLVLSDRRDAGDKEWIVTVTNQQIGEIDASHPLAQEWQRGREFIVWATGDREAQERTLRRFSARPGFAVKSVTPAGESVYSAASTGPKPP